LVCLPTPPTPVNANTVLERLKTPPRRQAGTLLAAVAADMASIGWMSVVNFLIDSDFKWLLLAYTVPWIAAVLLFLREGSQRRGAILLLVAPGLECFDLNQHYHARDVGK
jgi:hypothetical protein